MPRRPKRPAWSIGALANYAGDSSGLLAHGAMVRIAAEARAGWWIVEGITEHGEAFRTSVKAASLREPAPSLF